MIVPHIVYIEVFPNFPTKERFEVPLGEEFGNQLSAAMANGWTISVQSVGDLVSNTRLL